MPSADWDELRKSDYTRATTIAFKDNNAIRLIPTVLERRPSDPNPIAHTTTHHDTPVAQPSSDRQDNRKDAAAQMPTKRIRRIFGDFDTDLTADCTQIDRVAQSAQVVTHIRHMLDSPEARRVLRLSDELESIYEEHCAMVDKVTVTLATRPEWHRRALQPILREVTLPTVNDADESSVHDDDGNTTGQTLQARHLT
ncbi:hypothetical protein EN45_023520 [Penicillium chrysogenum]|uniref:Uncharacterized protein n=2 Tax=Penicillium chrysogenum species complex TaxID=254878 RepID=B6HC14_PENRW|nr:hypothetical protein EN45_023520 [Penicillium chrysogenum]CAP94746.1 hypothetical protein PCH_Pc18g05220 [Penicillium rubens Wisconsin 54-1255]